MLNYLEESGTEKLQTPLHIAAVNGHLEVVKVGRDENSEKDVYFSPTIGKSLKA